MKYKSKSRSKLGTKKLIKNAGNFKLSSIEFGFNIFNSY